MNVDAYLVLVKARGREPRVARVTQKRPSLAANEAMIKLTLDLPADVFEAPLFTVPVEHRHVEVAIEVDEV